MPVTLIFLLVVAIFAAGIAISAMTLTALVVREETPPTSTPGGIRCAIANCNAPGDVWNRHEHRRLCTDCHEELSAVRKGI